MGGLRSFAGASLLVAVLSPGCGGGEQGTAPAEGRARILEFPPNAIPEGRRAFGFEMEISLARVEDVHGLSPDWIVQIGPETGALQSVSGHCAHGVSALQEASALPRFTIRSTVGEGRGGVPVVSCALITTQDFEDFDTLECDMRLDHPGACR